jgi:hypothetical protein
MLSRIGAVITASGAAAALALALGAAPSSATTATTWTVKPGDHFSTSGTTKVRDTKTTTVVTCKVKRSFTAKGGSGLPGAGIASITAVVYSDCTVGAIAISPVVAHGLPWKVNATSYNAKTGVTTGTITGIDLVGSATGCRATLDGTAAGKDNGKVEFTYTNPTGALKLLPTGGNLHYWAVSGCVGLVANGDPAQASGTVTVKPKQTITSP